MKLRFANAVLAVGASLAAAAAGAKPYGLGEDLLWRPGHSFAEPAGTITWFFYALALLFVGWAIFRFKAHVDNPQRYGLGAPVSGVLTAAGLAALPWALGETASLLWPTPDWRRD